MDALWACIQWMTDISGNFHATIYPSSEQVTNLFFF